jgi:hypothetical protein
MLTRQQRLRHLRNHRPALLQGLERFRQYPRTHRLGHHAPLGTGRGIRALVLEPAASPRTAAARPPRPDRLLPKAGRTDRMAELGPLVPPRRRTWWRRIDLSPILVGGVSLRGQGRGIHRPAAQDLRQQASERGKRTNADLRLGREAQRHTGLWLTHPGRHLKASASIPTEAAPQRGATSSLGHRMDVDRETAPGVPTREA